MNKKGLFDFIAYMLNKAVILLSKSSKQGKCIFCNGSGLTKQHVWPDWFKNVLPRDGNEHTQFLTRFFNDYPNNTVIIQPDLIKRQGHTGTRKIRNVCVKCNTGWMSNLEEKAKPILISLIFGEQFTLDFDSQLIIASWAVMTSIMGEFTDIKTAAIPHAHRKIFMETNRPPVGWKIWVGRYRGEQWKQRYRHHGFALLPRNQVGKVKPEMNTQSSTFVMGELLIYATSSTILDINIEGDISRKLIPIWPLKETNINFILNGVLDGILTDDDANRISDYILFSIKNVGF